MNILNGEEIDLEVKSPEGSENIRNLSSLAGC